MGNPERIPRHVGQSANGEAVEPTHRCKLLKINDLRQLAPRRCKPLQINDLRKPMLASLVPTLQQNKMIFFLKKDLYNAF